MLKVTKHTIDRLDLNRNHCLKKVYKEKGLGHKVYDQIPAKFQREEGEIKILKKSISHFIRPTQHYIPNR